MTRFVFDDDPVDEDGLPAYGNSFVTQGYIYPFGFLINHEGTEEDGSPAYPEMVIGLWTCRGNFIGDGASTTTGPWVVSTQIYDFFDSPGYEEGKTAGWHTVVSEGYEIADVGKIARRAISGASGRASDVGDDMLQMLIGFNASGGVDLTLYIPEGFEPIIDPDDLMPTPPADQINRRCTWVVVEGLVCNDESNEDGDLFP